VIPFPITALLVLTPLIVIGALIAWVCDPENRKKVLYAIQFLFGVLLLAIFGPPYLLLICIALFADWKCKRRVRSALSLRQRN
jgi:hypothetical protein